ncbi:hypothetical protein BB559_007401 [Furculomyces boomerangus]|uniref:RING-type domain-containing protein n=2 Tax=Harpellales TaxID=61421 RepID=A0A2T9XXG4_9FUNG|nr:hypothetical protein BB559_007401 [Furculomyces boomerangus]
MGLFNCFSGSRKNIEKYSKELDYIFPRITLEQIVLYCNSLQNQIPLSQGPPDNLINGISLQEHYLNAKRHYRQMHESKEAKSYNYLNCSICTNSIEPQDTIRILYCRHVFHSRCVDKRTRNSQRNCPRCLQKLNLHPIIPIKSEIEPNSNPYLIKVRFLQRSLYPKGQPPSIFKFTTEPSGESTTTLNHAKFEPNNTGFWDGNENRPYRDGFPKCHTCAW